MNKTSKKFDLTKPETLFMSSSVDDELYNHVTESLFRKILAWGLALGVSDIVLQSNMPVKVKISNLVFNITKASIPHTAMVRFIGISRGAQDGDDSPYNDVISGGEPNTTYAFKLGKTGEKKIGVRYRVNSLRSGYEGVSMVMRLNSEDIYDLKDIGLSRESIIYKNMFPMKGINLITGSVDSGKTTLIYACLKEYILNDPRHAFIDTYENPIEGDLESLVIDYSIENKSVRQCPSPQGVKTFSEGIENSLRKNSDIILAGEVRTSDEVTAIINGALATGKLIMATLHTDSIPVTFSRLLNSLHSSNEGKMRALVYDLIKSMNMIVSQKLLTTVDLKRVAVNEVLIFDKKLKERLTSVPMERLTHEITQVMLESNNTMVDKARKLLSDNVISQEVFDDFENNFSY